MNLGTYWCSATIFIVPLNSNCEYCVSLGILHVVCNNILASIGNLPMSIELVDIVTPFETMGKKNVVVSLNDKLQQQKMRWILCKSLFHQLMFSLHENNVHFNNLMIGLKSNTPINHSKTIIPINEADIYHETLKSYEQKV